VVGRRLFDREAEQLHGHHVAHDGQVVEAHVLDLEDEEVLRVAVEEEI
jgi:hypothetical protein